MVSSKPKTPTEAVRNFFSAETNRIAVAVVLDVHEFHKDFTRLNTIVSSGPVKTLSYFRLRWLHSSFKMHTQLNSRREQDATEVNCHSQNSPHTLQDDPRDFQNIVKVDTHIHLAAAMTARHLLSFLKRKADQDKDVWLAPNASDAKFRKSS